MANLFTAGAKLQQLQSLSFRIIKIYTTKAETASCVLPNYGALALAVAAVI